MNQVYNFFICNSVIYVLRVSTFCYFTFYLQKKKKKIRQEKEKRNEVHMCDLRLSIPFSIIFSHLFSLILSLSLSLCVSFVFVFLFGVVLAFVFFLLEYKNQKHSVYVVAPSASFLFLVPVYPVVVGPSFRHSSNARQLLMSVLVRGAGY
jgi:hypothetical protein